MYAAISKLLLFVMGFIFALTGGMGMWYNDINPVDGTVSLHWHPSVEERDYQYLAMRLLFLAYPIYITLVLLFATLKEGMEFRKKYNLSLKQSRLIEEIDALIKSHSEDLGDGPTRRIQQIKFMVEGLTKTKEE